MIRNLSEINFYRDGWQTEFIDQLLRLYMIATGFKNNETLPALLQQDIRTLDRLTQNQEELKKSKPALPIPGWYWANRLPKKI